MFFDNRPLSFAGRAMQFSALMATFGLSVSMMSAQTSTPASSAAVTVQAPALDLQAYTSSNFTPDAASSSSADQTTTEAVVATDPLHLNAMQYGQRRYGKPRYRGANTNADGSNKWTGLAGGGFTQPNGNTYHYFTPSYGFQVGFGRQFSYKFAVPIQFDWDNFGLTAQTLNSQFNLYNNQIAFYNNTCVTTATNFCPTPFASLDGNAHVWSFSIDPTYSFRSGEGLGGYVVAGVGFYHKVTNFTTPTTGYEEDYYGDVYEYSANAIVDHYTSNAPGFNAGFGATYKFSRFSNERLYGEIRYVFIDNSHRNGITVYSPVNATTINVANEFPANSNRTAYFPVKFGIRF